MTLPDRAALGTMHGKAAAIAPPLAALGITLVVPRIDTDAFGTFTAETPRNGSMEQAARAKARAAHAATGLPHALASEGAYGPHPSMPFLTLGREILLWLDTGTGQEVVEELVDDSPSHDSALVASLEEAAPLLARIGFPETAVILSAEAAPNRPLAKGLRDMPALAAAFS
ncbi:MAG: hypothetical protein RIT14_1073, partial [Pseudomonadota bacterium]